MAMKFIPIAKPILIGKEKEYIEQCVKTGWISSQGEFIDKFEQAFAKYCGVKYGVANANGTTALHLALAALGIGPGDEVIAPDLTFISPVNAIIYTGAEPVLVDADKETWNIDIDKIEKEITQKTKAIIVVHLYGHPSRLDKILEIAKKYNLFVIEDCAEAHGAEYLGGKIGGFGHVSCFSFYGNKIITTGGGGMCLTNYKKLADKMRILLNHGMSPKKRYWHDQIGFNYRLTNIQAAIGLAQLEQIHKFLEEREQISAAYNRHLKDIDGLILPPSKDWAKPVCWLYSIIINRKEPKIRDRLIEGLRENNIDARPFFYPIHKMPPYKKYLKANQTFKTAEYLSKRGMSLPSYQALKKSDIKFICQTIKNVISS